jgi:ribonuclease P protein subunit RPR2
MVNKQKVEKEKKKKQAKIDVLMFFDKAKDSFKESKNNANMYVRKARNLAMKYNIRLNRLVKGRFCKHCYSYLVAGKNCRIRTREGKVIYYCLECKKCMRFLISKI